MNRSLGRLLASAVAQAFGGAVAGLLMSFYLDLPAGPAIVLMLGILYFAALLFAPNGLVSRLLPRRTHLEH